MLLTVNVRTLSISGSKSHSIAYVNDAIVSGNGATQRLSRYCSADTTYVISALLHQGVYYCSASIKSYAACKLVSLVAVHLCRRPLSYLCVNHFSQIQTHFGGLTLGLESWTFCGSRYRDKVHDDIVTIATSADDRHQTLDIGKACDAPHARNVRSPIPARSKHQDRDNGVRVNSPGRAKR